MCPKACLHWLLLLVLATAGLPAVHARDKFVPLRQLLNDYSGRGMALVYSRQLVAGLAVERQAITNDKPLDVQLQQTLTAYGLSLRFQAPSTWYIVRAATAVRPPAANRPAAREQPMVSVMEEIIVTSPHHRLERNRFSGNQLGQRELDSYPTLGRDVYRTLSSLPGQQSSGIGARQHTRGGNTDEVSYFIDGAPLIEPFHLRDFEALFGAVNPDAVQTVNVFHAGYPVHFGSRLGGVVDLQLLEPGAEFEGGADLNLLLASVLAAGRGKTWNWLVSGRRSTVDLVLDNTNDDYGRPVFNDQLVRLGGQTDTDHWSAGLLLTNDELDLKQETIGEEAKADFHALQSWAVWERTVTDRLAVATRIGFSQVENAREGLLDNALDAFGALAEERNFKVWSGSSTVTMSGSSPWVLRLGVDAQHQTGDFDVDIQADYGPLAIPFQPSARLLRRVSDERSGKMGGVHVALGRVVDEGLEIEVGLRYDLQDMDPVHDRVFSPRLQINYHRQDNWSFYLHAGRYAQMQNLYEIQLDDGLLELNPVQRLDHLSAGLTYEDPRGWSVDAAAYCRLSGSPVQRFENVYNRWVLLPELHADRVLFEPSRSRACGMDTALRWTVGDHLLLRAQYTLGRTDERIEGDWQPRPWDARHQARTSLQWQDGRWNFSVAAAWHSGWPTSSLQTMLDASRFGNTRLNGFFSLDFHAGRFFRMGTSSLEIYLDVSNATGRENEGGTIFSSAPGGIESRRRHLLPTIPNLGLRLQW